MQQHLWKIFQFFLMTQRARNELKNVQRENLFSDTDKTNGSKTKMKIREDENQTKTCEGERNKRIRAKLKEPIENVRS